MDETRRIAKLCLTSKSDEYTYNESRQLYDETVIEW